ncbi:hypothetical protein K438DRAFT_1782466 [Mycena galopus ATCC 62051]|nr:hypothetical protein K438DRAFT_1782466 [Mycena galopus ATCC 62051]
MLASLRAASYHEISQAFGNVELATWYALQNNYVESLDCKLEYLYPEKLVIVTYPSGVHKGFDILLNPIADLAVDHPSGSFIVDMNRDIRLPSRSSVTQDFAFGRNIKNSSPKYSILFECTSTQSPTNLSTKVNKCLDHADVDAVICFDIITSKKFRTPGSRPPADHDRGPAFSGPELEQRQLLGSVMFLGLNWGQVDDISLTIHHRNGSQEHFDHLAPVNGNLEDEDLFERQDEINIAFAKLIGKVMSMDVYREALKDQTFGLKWDEFYVALDACLMADAYEHYVDWMDRHQIVASFLKRCLSSEEGAGATEGEDLVNIVTRRSKKHKP